MLPALAELEAFIARIPGGVAGEDTERAEAVLEDASSLIRAEAGMTWVNDVGVLEGVPDVVATVTIAAARRAFVNPDMVQAETVDTYSATYASASPDVYLTKAEKQLVRRAAGRSGLWTLATTRVDAAGDLPSVHGEWPVTDAPEEVDPFGEGWTA